MKKNPVNRTSNENEVIETVRIGIEMANEKLQKDVDRLTKQLQSLPASDPARTKIQKQKINLGSGNNQHFVSIPYARFFWILTCVAAKAGIPVIETEESYTSKASLIDKDPIPVYKEGDNSKYQFSGKRISRGQYKSKEGTILNADVNGAGNIIRKVYPNAFDGVTDFSYTNKTVIRVTREALCHAKHKKKHARPQRKRGMNRWLHHRRQEQKLVYFALFKVSSAKDKTKYIEEN